MRTILLLASLAALLSGCAAPQPGAPRVNPPSDGYSQLAWNTYNRTTDADHTLGIRTNVLDAGSPLLRGIREACAKGVKVSILLYVTGRHTASAAADTCAEVYISDHPELQRSIVIMISDGILLAWNGSLVGANSRATEKEFYFQRHEKAMSQRIQ